MIQKSYNSGSYVAYTYNAEGSLARLSYGDSTGELASYRFEYDSLGRLIRSAELGADGGTVQRTEHIYDGYNRLSRQSWTLGGKTYTEYYSYDDATDGSMTLFRTTSGQKTKFTYDALRRLQKTTVTGGSGTLFTVARSYYTTGGKATTRTEYFNYRMPNGSLIAGDRYVYDALGNITELREAEPASGSSARRTKVRYTYDEQNQLKTETRYTYSSNTDTTGTSVTYTYNYDTAGNLQSVQKNGATVQTYTYGDSQWRDLLTKVGGTTISYDASGNPKNWYNGTTYTGLTWKNGRQLAQITTGGRTSAYRYDADGIRTYKKVGSVAHEYRTLNGKVVYEKIGSGSTAKIMIFSYDAQGRPFAVKYSTNNGGSYITYFYALNQQGDVVKIFRPLPSRDSNGNLNVLTEAVYATYTYDAWGNILSQSGGMASANPLRYRGYYYDSETGFYYLQSRYYDPATRRFINADALASTVQGFLGYNMFAYCNNKPVICADDKGNIFVIVIPGTSSDDEQNQTYTEQNVNIYMEGEGEYDPNKLNIMFYETQNGFININVENSLTITDNVEQREVLKLIINSKYYDPDIYGDIGFMQAQWIAHNRAYSIAASSTIGMELMKIFSNSSSPLESAKVLDLRPIENMGRKQRAIYRLISQFCGGTRRLPTADSARQLEV